jgi:hypothetical protein
MRRAVATLSTIFLLSAAAGVLGASAPAEAQTRRGAAPAHRIEAAVGVGLFGGAELGSTDANLRANSLQSTPYRIFVADAQLSRARAFDVRAGYTVSRRVGVEARFGMHHPELRAALSSDAEGAAPVTAVERLDRYFVDAGVTFAIDALRVGSLVPFAAGGGGYARQLHEGQTVVDEGRIYYVGGGAKYWLLTRARGAIKSIGIRGAARLNFVDLETSFSDDVQRHGSISASVVVGF